MDYRLKKAIICLFIGMLFYVSNSKILYTYIDKIFKTKLAKTTQKCPIGNGLIQKTIMFSILAYLFMGNPLKDINIKIKRTIYSATLFYMLSSPQMVSVISDEECVNNSSKTIYSFVFAGIMYYFMSH